MSLKRLGGWAILSSPPMLPFSVKADSFTRRVSVGLAIKALKLSHRRVRSSWCAARRRSVRYEDDEEEDGHNEEIAMLEFYSQSAKGEALIVDAVVDEEEVQVLIFKVSSFLFFFNHRSLFLFGWGLMGAS
jgi:hypothetical protein